MSDGIFIKNNSNRNQICDSLGRGRITKKHKETLGGDGSVHCLEYGDCFTYVHIYQNINFTFSVCAF